MRKLILLLLSLTTYAAAMALTHTVARGETLESIAQHYGITVEQLKDANPNVTNLFYTGMKLQIPEATAPIVVNTSAGAANPMIVHVPSTPETPMTENEKSENRFKPHTEHVTVAFDLLQFGFLKPEGCRTHLTYSLTAGATYWPTKVYSGFAIGASIGYREFEIRENFWKSKVSAITVPLRVAFAIGNEQFAFVPEVGLHLNLSVRAKANGNKVKAGKFGIGLPLGASFTFKNCKLYGAYVVNLNDEQKGWCGFLDGYPMVGFCAGF